MPMQTLTWLGVRVSDHAMTGPRITITRITITRITNTITITPPDPVTINGHGRSP